jgi:hypothetical protein
MNGMSKNPLQQVPVRRADRWQLFLAFALVAQATTFFCCPNIVVPPRVSSQLPTIEWAIGICVIPFATSLFLVICNRHGSERVIAYGSLAASLFWLGFAVTLVRTAIIGP